MKRNTLTKEILPTDEEIATVLQTLAKADVIIDNESRLFHDVGELLRDALIIPEAETDKKSEYFIYRAFVNAPKIKFNVITYIDALGIIHFAIVFRNLLITEDDPIEFYQDINLDYQMITETTNLNTPWRYLNQQLV